jgi:methionyl-tRNA formyltransferase
MLTKYYIWKQKSQFDCQQSLAPTPQPPSPTPYAALLKRDDGFIPWSAIQNLHPTINDLPSQHLQKAYMFAEFGILSAQSDPTKWERALQNSNSKTIIQFLSRLPRALAGYPSLWTIVQTTKGEKRMKILSFEPYIVVQIEGQQPSHFNQIKNQLQ